LRSDRPDRAIEIARALGVPLKIAAKIDKVDEAYFEETIKPMLYGPGVQFIGEINDAQKMNSSVKRRLCCFRSTGRSRSVL